MDRTGIPLLQISRGQSLEGVLDRVPYDTYSDHKAYVEIDNVHDLMCPYYLHNLVSINLNWP